MLAQKRVDEAIEQGIIDPMVHERILGNIDVIAQRSKIPQDAILVSLKNYYKKPQIDNISKLKKMSSKGSESGMYLVGDSNAINKFQALAGFLLRNFMDGAVMSAQEVISKKSTLAKDCQVLLIPDLYKEVSGGGAAAWKTDILKLISIIDARRMQGKITIVHVDNMIGLKETFGEVFEQTLKEHFYQL